MVPLLLLFLRQLVGGASCCFLSRHVGFGLFARLHLPNAALLIKYLTLLLGVLRRHRVAASTMTMVVGPALHATGRDRRRSEPSTADQRHCQKELQHVHDPHTRTSEEHTSELHSRMLTSYAVICFYKYSQLRHTHITLFV